MDVYVRIVFFAPSVDLLVHPYLALLLLWLLCSNNFVQMWMLPWSPDLLQYIKPSLDYGANSMWIDIEVCCIQNKEQKLYPRCDHKWVGWGGVITAGYVNSVSFTLFLFQNLVSGLQREFQGAMSSASAAAVVTHLGREKSSIDLRRETEKTDCHSLSTLVHHITLKPGIQTISVTAL